MDNNVIVAIVAASGAVLGSAGSVVIGIVAILANNKRFDDLNKRLDKIDSKIEQVESTLAGYVIDVAVIKNRLGLS